MTPASETTPAAATAPTSRRQRVAGPVALVAAFVLVVALLMQGHGLPRQPTYREQWQACDELPTVDARVGCYGSTFGGIAHKP